MSEIPEFESLDEATHHLYLAGDAGPILCRVDGSRWLAWKDGRSKLVVDDEDDVDGCIVA
ncbi:hypothetical protein EDF77_1909 [Stenotrophomonas maltophilia]|uniref:hypothetical protein n=1 Tax=Stenotrophomonas chelatiphaga TaxID=517011 RepID=UPI000F4C3FC0|nr:hypothetical protein [Stenotrophomonas chelatiphaga]MCS4231379.1 hypothetical protein [Stenotrophomonas chelatiphaga]ROQ42435.1 hypothetical protein EDF77_1909 [Stenotrophomonas maltophilia]